MKKLFLLLILAIGFLSFDKFEKEDANKKLTKTELEFIKENYNWNSEEFLIINFTMPKNSCHYNNYANLKKSSKWWTSFYSKMKLDNVHNIFVYSNSYKAKKIIDSKTHFEDTDSFILANFFSKDKSCYGIVIINKNGAFQKKAGEYVQKDITRFINRLK